MGTSRREGLSPGHGSQCLWIGLPIKISTELSCILAAGFGAQHPTSTPTPNLTLLGFVEDHVVVSCFVFGC